MTDIRAQVSIKTDDAIAANYVTNSWCIKSAAEPSDAHFDAYTLAFKGFYDTMRTYFGDTVAQNNHEIKYYDLEQLVPPNYPLSTKTFNLTSNPGVDGMPSEVALCLSFQGQRAPGFPQSRRRGRIYFGPIVSTASAGGRPTSAIITALAGAGHSLSVALQAVSGNSTRLAVWSSANADAVEVTDGWVDNAFDTQRRRGIERTARTTWVY